MPPKQNNSNNSGKNKGGSSNNAAASNNTGGNAHNNKKKNNTNNKHAKNDNDFDALLSAAVEANKAVLQKNNRKGNANNNNITDSSNEKSDINGDGNSSSANKYKSLADKENVVPSSADHIDNPYRPAFDAAHPRQTWPEPTIPVSAQFPHNQYPPGEICVYPLEINAYRYSSAEKRALEMANEQQIQDLRRAAEVHRQVRT